jgi:hypothetical protein
LKFKGLDTTFPEVYCSSVIPEICEMFRNFPAIKQKGGGKILGQ